MINAIRSLSSSCPPEFFFLFRFVWRLLLLDFRVARILSTSRLSTRNQSLWSFRWLRTNFQYRRVRTNKSCRYLTTLTQHNISYRWRLRTLFSTFIVNHGYVFLFIANYTASLQKLQSFCFFNYLVILFHSYSLLRLMIIISESINESKKGASFKCLAHVRHFPIVKLVTIMLPIRSTIYWPCLALCISFRGFISIHIPYPYKFYWIKSWFL